MGTERARRALAAGCGAVVAAALCAPLTVDAGAAWWEPLALAGQRVTAVAVDTAGLHVTVGGVHLVSHDGGQAFTLEATAPPAGASVSSGGVTWAIREGAVVTGPSASSLRPDPGAPFLGDGAHLIAAPAATPGVVVAVATDNHVWRRTQSGSWATALVLLPAGGLDGTPAVTGAAAFTQPLSSAVYLGVDGYGVLLSSNGGDDWTRADPGLPDGVLGLATDAAGRALYAGTASGLFVHHLQSFPAPPTYHDAALWERWAGIIAVCLAAAGAAVLALRALTSPG